MPRYMLAYVGRSPTVHNLVLRSYTMHELRNQNVVTSSPVRRKQLLCFGHREGARVKNAARMRVFPASGAYLPLKL